MRKTIIALAALAACGAAEAQTKWDMPTPYADELVFVPLDVLA